ncbi:MAG: 23S rRNA (pseudouridine(1915)-N(3))-methyltransferase RlmH [Fusobacteriaceae bacterium]|nr:23S rRNA (pseudouridine(1915)-N(3))-methyltransferase RlmH [Fusobacteriaceae bacterium]
MNIIILCVGKIKEDYINKGIEEFLKRLKVFAKINIMELKEETADKNISLCIEKESKNILSVLEKIKGYNILLYINGESFSSEGFAETIKQLSISGHSSLVFIIGGSNGVSDSIVNYVDMKISFSKFTFPHQLIRLILLEQIYRSFNILNNGKYHK